MAKYEILTRVYGRSRKSFQREFPLAVFEGYECGCKFAWFSCYLPISKILAITTRVGIKVLECRPS